MKNPILIFALLCVLSSTSGCATLLGGSTQKVKIRSVPAGAEVFMNGDFVGSAPLEIELYQQLPPLIVLKKDGFVDTRVEIRRGFSGWTMTNLILGPLCPIGFGLDFRAGTEKSFSETKIVVPLLSSGTREMQLYGGNVLLSDFSENGRGADILKDY